jgi:hypothetical protein
MSSVMEFRSFHFVLSYNHDKKLRSFVFNNLPDFITFPASPIVPVFFLQYPVSRYEANQNHQQLIFLLLVSKDLFIAKYEVKEFGIQ